MPMCCQRAIIFINFVSVVILARKPNRWLKSAWFVARMILFEAVGESNGLVKIREAYPVVFGVLTAIFGDKDAFFL